MLAWWRGDAEAGWRVSRTFVPRIAVWLAPAAGYGVERIPLEGGAVVAANHFSGIDHPLIGAFSPRTIYFLAKAELFEVPVLGAALRSLGVFGVRRGKGDRDALRQARKLAGKGNLVGIHLEGTRQRFGHPGPMHPGGLMIAMQEGVPVIPCGLDTFGWSPTNRRLCALVWGDPMRLDLPRNRRGYAQATEIVGAEIVRLWRQAAHAAAAGLPPELPDGAKRSGINPKLPADDGAGPLQVEREWPGGSEPSRMQD